MNNQATAVRSPSYGIFPEHPITAAAYQWRFDARFEADEAAQELAREHRVAVFVVEVLGAYEPAVVWNPTP